jgi:alkylresorcinol/alkylpyrone synthase
MARILAVDVAFPAHYYSQAELARALATANGCLGSFEEHKVSRFFSAVAVKGRHLALPLEAYRDLRGFGARNAAWLDCALPLGEEVTSAVLGASRLPANDIGLFASSTVTGVAVPSVESRLMNRLGFSSDCRRLPLFGLGCAAGAAGIARISDYLTGHPRDAALLLCVELCSLTFQPDDLSAANLVACALFGDGAGCVLLVGDEHPLAASAKPRVVDTRSVLFPSTERTMGWDMVDTGFQIVLNRNVPELARTALAENIRAFLAAHGLCTRDIAAWIAHPGGPAVIDSMEQGLELPSGALDASRESLARSGNLSSASVLDVLRDALERRHLAPGSHGLLLAMGPGFSAELVLLRW